MHHILVINIPKPLEQKKRSTLGILITRQTPELLVLRTMFMVSDSSLFLYDGPDGWSSLKVSRS